MAFTLPRRGAYSGRLAFDPDSGFHIDPKGRKVVTMDHGKTWRYAKVSDSSHNLRYAKRYLVVDTTANAVDPEPHHFQVQPHDDHYHPDPEKNFTNLKFLPDHAAAAQTSHTDAYKDQS